MADILGGHVNFLNLPLFIKDDYVRKQMRLDPNNTNVLEKGTFADMALTSITDVAHIRERQFWLEYMTDDIYNEILDKGAAGAIFAHFFDSNGRIIDCTWNKKCVTISFNALKYIPNVVVIASSSFKAEAILSAMRGNLIKTLITDGTTATEILRLNSLTK
jgi:deoxyribonucleoside regulator